MQNNNCPFCEIQQMSSNGSPRIILSNEEAILIEDGFPVSEGHSLVIPRRHFESFFEATEREKHALLQLLDKAKEMLDERHGPDAYNIGINDGRAAGQTVPHLHIHLIPRYEQASGDPRGGVRWVIPDKADYWSQQ